MRRSGEPPPDGDQLRLDLFPGEPWDGRSPRALTKSAQGLYLRPEPPRHEVMHVRLGDGQGLWPEGPHGEKGRRRSLPAASLVLKSEVDRGEW